MKKKDRPKAKQIIKDAAITLRLTEQQTIALIKEKIPSISISSHTFYNLKNEIKEENKQWFDMLAMSRYGYVEEYKELIESEKTAMIKAFEIANDKQASRLEINAALRTIDGISNTIKSIYQYMPQVLLRGGDITTATEEEGDNLGIDYDISKDPEAQF